MYLKTSLKAVVSVVMPYAVLRPIVSLTSAVIRSSLRVLGVH